MSTSTSSTISLVSPPPALSSSTLTRYDNVVGGHASRNPSEALMVAANGAVICKPLPVKYTGSVEFAFYRDIFLAVRSYGLPYILADSPIPSSIHSPLFSSSLVQHTPSDQYGFTLYDMADPIDAHKHTTLDKLNIYQHFLPRPDTLMSSSSSLSSSKVPLFSLSSHDDKGTNNNTTTNISTTTTTTTTAKTTTPILFPDQTIDHSPLSCQSTFLSRFMKPYTSLPTLQTTNIVINRNHLAYFLSLAAKSSLFPSSLGISWHSSPLLPDGTPQTQSCRSYLLLESLTVGFKSPIIADIKLGPRSWDCLSSLVKIESEISKLPSQIRSGCRVVGVSGLKPCNMAIPSGFPHFPLYSSDASSRPHLPEKLDAKWGRGLTSGHDLAAALCGLFTLFPLYTEDPLHPDGPLIFNNENCTLQLILIDCALYQLSRILALSRLFPSHFSYSLSLLCVYEGDKDILSQQLKAWKAQEDYKTAHSTIPTTNNNNDTTTIIEQHIFPTPSINRVYNHIESLFYHYKNVLSHPLLDSHHNESILNGIQFKELINYINTIPSSYNGSVINSVSNQNDDDQYIPETNTKPLSCPLSIHMIDMAHAFPPEQEQAIWEATAKDKSDNILSYYRRLVPSIPPAPIPPTPKTSSYHNNNNNNNNNNANNTSNDTTDQVSSSSPSLSDIAYCPDCTIDNILALPAPLTLNWINTPHSRIHPPPCDVDHIPAFYPTPMDAVLTYLCPFHYSEACHIQFPPESPYCQSDNDNDSNDDNHLISPTATQHSQKYQQLSPLSGSLSSSSLTSPLSSLSQPLPACARPVPIFPSSTLHGLVSSSSLSMNAHGMTPFQQLIETSTLMGELPDFGVCNGLITLISHLVWIKRHQLTIFSPYPPSSDV